MGRIRTTIVVLAALAWYRPAQADWAPVKIAGVPDGPISLGVEPDALRMRRSFRLVPERVHQVEIEEVRLLGCTDDKSQACEARVEPGPCAGGCKLSADHAGEITVVVETPTPGVYRASLEIVYELEDRRDGPDKPGGGATAPDYVQDGPPDDYGQEGDRTRGTGQRGDRDRRRHRHRRAILATTLQVTRPSSPVRPMNIAVLGAHGADAEMWVPMARGHARLPFRLQDDLGGARTIDRVVATPLVRKRTGDEVATDATVTLFTRVDGRRTRLASGSSLEVPPAGVDVEIDVGNIGDAGTYEGRLRMFAHDRSVLEVAYTITVRESAWFAGILIALGALISFGVQSWVRRGRRPLVLERRLERLRSRLGEIEVGNDRDQRLIDALSREIDDRLDTLRDGDDLTDEVVARLGRRIDLAGTAIRTGAELERLPPSARGLAREQLEQQSAVLLDRQADDAKLADVTTALAGIASDSVRRGALTTLLAEVDTSVEQARAALSPALQQRLASEVDPARDAARRAATADRLDDLDRELRNARLGLARIQGASLRERLTDAPPAYGEDQAGFDALRTDVGGRLDALDKTDDPDEAAALYHEAGQRLATTLGQTTARWCRAQAAGKPSNVVEALTALADQADAASRKPVGEALLDLDRIGREAAAALAGPQATPTSARFHGGGRVPMRHLPLPGLMTPIHRGPHPGRVGRIGRRIVFGDGVVLLGTMLIAVASGLKLLWTTTPTWGGWNDWLTAILWGAGLHAVGNQPFRGLLGLRRDRGENE